MVSTEKSRSIEQVLKELAGDFAAQFIKLLTTAFKNVDPEDILHLFGKEMPEQEITLCEENCGAPATVGSRCVVHFVARLLSVDLVVAVAILNSKKVELPPQWATDQTAKRM